VAVVVVVFVDFDKMMIFVDDDHLDLMIFLFDDDFDYEKNVDDGHTVNVMNYENH